MRHVYRFLAVLAVLPACGGDEGGVSVIGADAAVMADAGAQPDGSNPNDDGNDSFGEAQPIVIGDSAGVSGVIQAPNDRDFYKFTATAGQWLAVTSTANQGDDPDMLDTVIEMYGPNSTTDKVAENDDGVPRINTDSEILIQIPAAGEYHLRVLDYTDWEGAGNPPEFGADYSYSITVLDASTAPNTSVERADPTTPTTVTIPRVLLGKFDSATDVDQYTVVLAAPGMFGVSAMPDGPTGYGSTADIGDLWITDSGGTNILARVNASMGPFMGPFEVQPSLAAGTYQIFVKRQPGGRDTNPFWVAKIGTGTENPKEMADATNGAPATAEALTMMTNGTGTVGFVLAELTAVNDVDVFSFALPAGQNANVFCASARNGSGVIGLSGQVLASDRTTVLKMGNESLTTGLSLTAVTGAAGTYYVRLAKTGQSADVRGTWVRCGVSTFVPMA